MNVGVRLCCPPWSFGRPARNPRFRSCSFILLLKFPIVINFSFCYLCLRIPWWAWYLKRNQSALFWCVGNDILTILMKSPMLLSFPSLYAHSHPSPPRPSVSIDKRNWTVFTVGTFGISSMKTLGNISQNKLAQQNFNVSAVNSNNNGSDYLQTLILTVFYWFRPLWEKLDNFCVPFR